MTSSLLLKAARSLSVTTASLTHPAAPALVDQIAALRAQLAKLRDRDPSDPMAKMQVKNVETQLSKKKQALAGLKAPVATAATEAAATDTVAPRTVPAPAARGLIPRSTPVPTAPRAIGTFGERFKGAIPETVKQTLARSAPPAPGDVDAGL